MIVPNEKIRIKLKNMDGLIESSNIMLYHELVSCWIITCASSQLHVYRQIFLFKLYFLQLDQ